MEKKLHTINNEHKIRKNIVKVQNFVAKPKVKYTILVVFLVVFAYIVQYLVNKPNFGTFLSSDMDPLNNVYVLGVNENNGEYKITKINPNGSTVFKINLEKSPKNKAYVYSNLEVDSKGNFYFVKQIKDLNAVVSDKSMYPTISETVLMYDTNGNFIKQIANTDFSEDANPPVDPYIRKIQIVDQKMTIFACKNNYYDVITAYPLTKDSPKKEKSFSVLESSTNVSKNTQWVGDIAMLSSGRVFYSTLNGELYASNNEGVFENYSSIINQPSFQITSMSVDPEDNVYLNDCVNGKFYKFNSKSGMLQTIYNLENKLSSNLNIKMKDVRKIKALSTDDYYAASKSFDKPYHVRFGSRQVHLVGDLRGKMFPLGYLIMILVIAVGIGLYFTVKYLLKLEIKHTSLATRILAVFLPTFVISMGILLVVNTNDGVSEYIGVLRKDQERGANVAASIISGNNFSSLNHISGYMSSDYTKLKDEIQKGHNTATLNTDDKSDYIVTYIESYGKLYTTINTKYSVSSNSYEKLKYTSPDMIPQNYALADYLLEEDETKILYEAWEKLSEKSNNINSFHATFKDVYGNLSATFVPIKNEQGTVVGLVGNFLDEGIHNNRVFWQILAHSSALILIITILIAVLACLVIAWSLRPLKKIEQAIDKMSKGIWDTRIRVTTKDELADIAGAFNLMSEKIQRYTSNLIKLNKEYSRYVPQEIFKLMGKEKITQVELFYHKLIKNLNMVFVTFNISCKECFDFEEENKVFSAVNKSYEEIFKIVENNNGMVQSFNGIEAVILFPKSPIDALSSSIQFKEIEIPEEIKTRMHVTVGSGEILFGVSGNENRRNVIGISDEIMQLFSIDKNLNNLEINHVATGKIMKMLDGSNLPFTYRYIGRAESPTDSNYEDIYQIIDGNNKYIKDLYLSTKDMFENGVNSYLEGNFEKARNLFASVLRINGKDKVSIKYLMLCENEISKIEKNPNSREYFNGHLI